MKTFCIIAFAFLLCICAQAGILFGGFTLTTVTTAQTNSASFYTNTGYIYLPQVTITNNTLSISNAYQGYFRWSFDGITFYTNNSPIFIPTNTTAATYVVPQQSVALPIIVQMLAITNSANTGTIQVGATSP